MLTPDISVDALRSAVEQHYFHVDGVRYGCTLRWAAVERDCDPMAARVLLNVDLVAAPAASAPPSSLHLVVQLGSLAELSPLLNDALCDYVAQQLSGIPTNDVGERTIAWRVPFPLDGARPN